MPRIDVMFPSEFISGLDILAQPGQQAIVTIESITKESIPVVQGGRRMNQDKWIVRMVKAKKKWILNKTSALTLAMLYGPNSEQWIGKRATLVTQRQDVFGKMKDVIHVKPEIPPATKPKVVTPVEATPVVAAPLAAAPAGASEVPDTASDAAFDSEPEQDSGDVETFGNDEVGSANDSDPASVFASMEG